MNTKCALTIRRHCVLCAWSIAIGIFPISLAHSAAGGDDKLTLATGTSLTISTTLQATSKVTLTLPPPMKAPAAEPTSDYSEVSVRTLNITDISGRLITKFQLRFSKIEHKTSETGVDGKTQVAQADSSSLKNKKFAVICESGKEAVESDSASVSPQERTLALRECTNSNALLSVLEVLNKVRIAKDSRKFSLEEVSALLGGIPLKGQVTATVTFEGEASDGTISFKFVTKGENESSDNGTWHGTIVQSKDEMHIETNADGTNEATQLLGKSKLKSVSVTTITCKQSLSLKAR